MKQTLAFTIFFLLFTIALSAQTASKTVSVPVKTETSKPEYTLTYKDQIYDCVQTSRHIQFIEGGKWFIVYQNNSDKKCFIITEKPQGWKRVDVSCYNKKQ